MPYSTALQLARLTGLSRVFRYGMLRSTNSQASLIAARQKIVGPWAVLATRQTAGRGRGDNRWFSDAGSLTVTFALPVSSERSPGELTLRAGLAVRRALAHHIDADRLAIKWPNDVLADGKKLCGILCERVSATDLIGVGVNLAGDFKRAPAEVQRRATSLAMLLETPQALADSGRRMVEKTPSPRPSPGGRVGQRECQGSSSSDSTLKPQAALPSPIDVFIDLAFALRDVWDAAEWHAELSRVHALTGKRIAVATPGGETLRGLCTGIDRTGRLLIDDNHAHHKIVAGSIVEM